MVDIRVEVIHDFPLFNIYTNYDFLANTSLMNDDHDPSDVASSLYDLINKINGTKL